LSQYLFREGDPAERKLQEQRLAAFLAKIRSLVRMKSGERLAAVSPERREEMIRLFGQPTTESIAEAAATGAVLWTDDIAVAEVARERAGVERRVWTQLVFRSTAATDLFADLTLFLLEWRYFFTRIEPEVVVPAGNRAGWDPDQLPLASVLQWVQTPGLDEQSAFLVSARMLPLIWRNAPFTHQREAVTQALARELLKRPGGRRMIASIISVINELFPVDVFGGEGCKRSLQAALVRKPTTRLIIPPGVTA
jgi:hypothetical protein